MAEVVRFGVSMDAELLAAFDHLLERKQYDNRSEAIRDLVREALTRNRREHGDGVAVAALCLVYDHKSHDLTRKLIRLQHEHLTEVISTMHVHLDHDDCFEVIVLKGRIREIQALADKVMATRGIRHGRLIVTADPD